MATINQTPYYPTGYINSNYGNYNVGHSTIQHASQHASQHVGHSTIQHASQHVGHSTIQHASQHVGHSTIQHASQHTKQVNRLFNAAPYVYRDISVPPPGITLPPKQILPDRKWLIDVLKRNLFNNNGILAGGILAADIRYEYTRNCILSWINEIYPLNKYAITPEWIESSLANPNFLPNIPGNLRKKLINEYWTGKANARSNRVCNFTCVIKPENFIAYIQSISTDIEPYFKVHIESNQPLETFIPKGLHLAKVVLGFWNYLSTSIQFITIFIESNLDIPFSLLEYQHEFITYNGRDYSVLPSYSQVIKEDLKLNNSELNNSEKEKNDEQIDNSLGLLEIINNIRNGVYVLMPYTELVYPGTLIDIKEKINKLSESGLGIDSTVTLDRIINTQTKLDYYVNIHSQQEAYSSSGANGCARCKVVIESGEFTCSTKCCQRIMHASCLLDLYLNEDCKHATFKCDKCNIVRLDKHGRNTEILMGLCGLGC